MLRITRCSLAFFFFLLEDVPLWWAWNQRKTYLPTNSYVQKIYTRAFSKTLPLLWKMNIQWKYQQDFHMIKVNQSNQNKATSTRNICKCRSKLNKNQQLNNIFSKIINVKCALFSGNSNESIKNFLTINNVFLLKP